MKRGIEPSRDVRERAFTNFKYLYCKLVKLFAMGDVGSLARAEAAQLAESLAFVLGINASDNEECEGRAFIELAELDPDDLLRCRQADLTARVEKALATWRLVCAIMPPLNNVSLRDSLAEIGELKSLYDTYFAAHEVPLGNLQYQLSVPTDESLCGIDYVQAWLNQLLCETRWIARFTPQSCIAVLERVCPDYRGLHVNLYDLLKPNENELVRTTESESIVREMICKHFLSCSRLK